VNGTSIDTLAFDEVQLGERFRVVPPPGNTLVVGETVEVTRSQAGTNVVSAADITTGDTPPVERLLDEVIARCERDVGERPEDARSHLSLALALLNRGRRTKAIEELKRVLELAPDHFVALNALASAHLGEGSLDEAAEFYGHIAATFPNNPTAYMGLASVALRRDNFVGAAQHLETAVSIDRRLVPARLLLAMVQLKVNRAHRAISILREGLRENTRSAELNHGLAIVYLCVGDYRRAEKSFRAALYLNPGLSAAVHGLALLLLHQKRTDDVMAFLSKRLAFSPNDITSRELLAHAFLVSKDFKRARAHLTNLVDEGAGTVLSSHDAARINNNIAHCYAMEARYNEAEERLLLSLKIEPSFAPQPYENLARVYLAVGRTRDALRTIDRALDRALDSIGLHELRAFCLTGLKRYHESVEELRMLVKRVDAPASAYADLGWMLTEWEEDYDSAIAVLREAMDRWSDNPKILNNLAYAHLMRGENGAARLVLDLIPESFGPEPYSMATRGFLKITEGKIAEGESDYNFAESLAARAGDRDLALAIRQKKFLEISREYLRQRRFDEAADALKKGSEIEQNSQPYPFTAQLKSLLAAVSAKGEK
jgi:tetratricopeptide (TPR) repeat protein